MSCEELQAEELEVLHSIYDGDDCFKELNVTAFQYKIGEDGHYTSFLIEIKWGEKYPEELPDINLDAFYNKHISDKVKSSIVSRLQEEAKPLLETAMTYTLFEWAKENASELTEKCQEISRETEVQSDDEKCAITDSNISSAKPKEKKEQLTKAQKRKMHDRLNAKGETPRGYDWMDIVRHLSQTGKHDQQEG